jgi:hypothetical protein
MSSIRLPRWLVLSLLVSGLALGLIPWAVEEAGALPQQERFCTFYSDAARTQYTGSCFYSCLGVSCTGTKTSYFTCRDGKLCYNPSTCSDAPWCDPRWENCCSHQ